jgi:hypothetical protein
LLSYAGVRRRDVEVSNDRLSADRLAGILRLLQSDSPEAPPMKLFRVVSPQTSVAGRSLDPDALESAHGGSLPEVLAPEVPLPEVLAPEVLAPEVLPDALLAPEVLAPEVLPDALLAPEVPLPAVLAPAVLAPELPLPALLVPEVLVPAVLVPAVLAPAVLAPAVLAPAVLVPAVLAPAVLVRGRHRSQVPWKLAILKVPVALGMVGATARRFVVTGALVALVAVTIVLVVVKAWVLGVFQARGRSSADRHSVVASGDIAGPFCFLPKGSTPSQTRH